MTEFRPVKAKVWAVLKDHNDDLAAGPFASCADANRYVAGFPDVYATEVDQDWFWDRYAQIQEGLKR